MESRHIINLKNLHIIIIAFGIVFGITFFVFSLINVLLFHTISAFFIMVLGLISGSIGIIYLQQENKNIYSRVSSSVVMFSLLLFLHNISYEGMQIFEIYGFNFSLQLFVGANLILCLGFLVSVADIKNKISSYVYVLVPVIIGSIILFLAFFDLLPQMYNETTGITAWKTGAGILNIVILIVTIIIWYRHDLKNKTDHDRNFIFVLVYMLISQIIYLFGHENHFILFFASAFSYSGFLTLLDRSIVMNIMLPYNSMYRSIIEERNRLSRSQEIGHVGTWELDLKTKKIWGSDEAFKIYGMDVTEDHLIDLKKIQKVVISEDRMNMDIALDELIKDNKPYNVIFSIINPQGDFHHINSVATLEFDDNNTPIKVNGVIHDITELKNEQIKLRYASTHDYLTGVFNRRYYGEQLGLLDKDEYLPLSVIIIDINGLKVINDSFGHDEGNKVLKRVASISNRTIPTSKGFIARVGGDEFIIMLKNTTHEHVVEIQKNLASSISREKVGNIQLTVAFGVATKSDPKEDLDEVIRYAEDEMYRYKISDSSSFRNKIIDALLNTLYEKDNISEEHSQRVSEFASELAIACNLSDQKVSDIKLTGMLHDIGKITISNEILNKKTKLTKEEYELIKNHSEKGYKILHSLGNMDIVANYVLQHHERIDGFGYPNGLKGDDISIEAKIIAIADAYDAMTSFREYKPSLTKEEAIAEIRRCEGSQFDSDIAEIFIEKVLNKKEIA